MLEIHPPKWVHVGMVVMDLNEYLCWKDMKFDVELHYLFVSMFKVPYSLHTVEGSKFLCYP